MRIAFRWLLGALVVAVAAWLLARQLHALSWSALARAWQKTPPASIAGALGCVALSFSCLGLYEVFAANRAAPGRVPTACALAIGLVAHALSNTLGFHVITGSAFRLRAYRGFGLGAGEVASVLARVAACVVLGVLLVSVLAFLASPAWRAPAMLALSLAAMFFVVVSRRLPTAGHSARRLLAQMRGMGSMLPVAAVEMLAMMAALWLLLPSALQPAPADFALLFVAGMLAGIAAHAPGGIGIFEATLLTAAPAGHASDFLAALLLYRALYNLLPFALATLAAPFVLASPTPDARRDCSQLEGG